METLIMIGNLLLGLSLLVGLHEFGHFAAAKYFKIRVDKFYIFFDFLFPLPNVLNFALLKKKVGGTEYGIGWFPLGGYVAIHGMIDETQDAESLAAEPQPDEFRAKPAWQRLIVMLGGIIMNVITGIVVFTLLTYIQGESYLPAAEARYGIVPNGLGREIGFRTGDKIVKINGRPFTEFDEVRSPDFLLGDNSFYTIERDGKLLDLNLPSRFMDKLTANGDSLFVAPRVPFVVGRVVSGQPAADAGLKAGDKLVRIGEQPIQYFDELQKALLAQAGKPTAVGIVRDGQPQTLTVKVTSAGKMGFEPKPLLHYSTRHFSLLESVPLGIKNAFGIIAVQAKAITKIFKGQASAVDSLGGPVEIAQQYGGQWDWLRFWVLTGSLSMVLAFMNLLPIPALDGGHVLFLLYEMIAGRKPSDKFLENAQKVGTLMIMALMVFVLFKPLIKVFLK
ncbi:RIP metalloprotease RseP [Hymenobacter sp. YC55]|uniref:RIP metalloprotease RseP n=1 Tax=Hymenobacter sp. YC55 TaxID=3034019 RepID=UPI0023F7CC2A|nr:RIP metalloprotease RseP [Hymenobacter sp. YC55]MDF7813480.1 RIP metalloprotease RseP [Hymenobacter sp. YC55]